MTTQDVSAPDQSWGDCDNPTTNWPYQGHKIPYLVLFRGPPTACQHSGQTLTIEHILLECTVLQQSHDEYHTVDSLRTLFETIPEACIIEFLREAGFYYLMWMARYPTQLFIKSVTNWRHSQVELIPTTEHHHWNTFIERKQRWENPTCEEIYMRLWSAMLWRINTFIFFSTLWRTCLAGRWNYGIF